MISVMYGHLVCIAFVQVQLENRPFSFVHVEVSESGDFGQDGSIIILRVLRTKSHEIFHCMMRSSLKISKRSYSALTTRRSKTACMS